MEEQYKESEATMKKFSPVFEELGKISIFFSNMEFIITEVLTYLINEKELFVGFTIINEYPIYKKIDLLNNLIERSGTHRITNEIKNEFLDIYKDFEKIRVKRNDLIHRLWILDEKDYPKIKQIDIKFRKNKKENSFERRESETTMKEIRKVSSKAQKISVHMISLGRKILNNLKTDGK